MLRQQERHILVVMGVRGLQLRSTWCGRLPPPAAAWQREVLQIASLTQANGPSCALVAPGCCSLLQERLMIVQGAFSRWGKAGGGPFCH